MVNVLTNHGFKLLRPAFRRCAVGGSEASLIPASLHHAAYNRWHITNVGSGSPRLPELHSTFNASSPTCLIVKRYYKSRKTSRDKGEEEHDRDSDESDDEEIGGKDSQVMKAQAASTRVDAVLKAALGMSRNKVDNAFYSSSIYLNGEKLLKKSESVTIEDELDVVRGVNALNSSFLDVSRVEVLDVTRSRSDESKVSLKLRRFKRLTVDNYRQPWKPSDD